MSGERLRRYLRRTQTHYEETDHDRAVPSQEVARAEHESGWHVAKPVLLVVGQRMAMAVLPAPLYVDMHKVRSWLGRDDVYLAEEEDFAELFPDCELGAEPPFGNLYGMPVLMDRRMMTDPYLVFRGGTHDRSMRVATKDYVKLVRPLELDMGTLLH